jgi:hypothetical protein
MSSGDPQPVAGISRRGLLKRGGEVAAAAAVASVFSPFVFTGKAAATKTLSFWQFYAPSRELGIQSKWFEDCVKGWNATHDVKSSCSLSQLKNIYVDPSYRRLSPRIRALIFS